MSVTSDRRDIGSPSLDLGHPQPPLQHGVLNLFELKRGPRDLVTDLILTPNFSRGAKGEKGWKSSEHQSTGYRRCQDLHMASPGDIFTSFSGRHLDHGCEDGPLWILLTWDSSCQLFPGTRVRVCPLAPAYLSAFQIS